MADIPQSRHYRLHQCEDEGALDNNSHHGNVANAGVRVESDLGGLPVSPVKSECNKARYEYVLEKVEGICDLEHAVHDLPRNRRRVAEPVEIDGGRSWKWPGQSVSGNGQT